MVGFVRIQRLVGRRWVNLRSVRFSSTKYDSAGYPVWSGYHARVRFTRRGRMWLRATFPDTDGLHLSNTTRPVRVDVI